MKSLVESKAQEPLIRMPEFENDEIASAFRPKCGFSPGHSVARKQPSIRVGMHGVWGLWVGGDTRTMTTSHPSVS